MRLVFATACLCLITCSASIAADQKLFNDRLAGMDVGAPGSGAVTVAHTTVAHETLPDRLPLDPNPLDASPAELSAGAPPFGLLADRPIDIPQQTGDEALLAPHDLPLPPERPDPKPAKKVVYRSTEEVCDTLSQAAQTNNIPAPFFIRLLFQESKFKPDAVSHVGAQGIAQFMPETAEGMGLDNPFDPLQAIPAAARLLRRLVDRFGNLGLAAAAYNAGPGKIQHWLDKKGALPSETKGYVKVITGVPAETWKGGKKAVADKELPERAPCQDIVVASAEPEGPVLPPPAPDRRKAETEDRPGGRAKSRLAARKAPHAKVAAHKAAHKTTVSLAARKHQRPERKRVASR